MSSSPAGDRGDLAPPADRTVDQVAAEHAASTRDEPPHRDTRSVRVDDGAWRTSLGEALPWPAMRGIILAGGSGTRLYPITRGISKQIMPVYDKPMIYYPLSTLMMAGIREVLVITTPEDQAQFRAAARRRHRPRHPPRVRRAAAPGGTRPGLRDRRRLHRRRAGRLVLGDNIFYGAGLGRSLKAQPRRRGRPGLRLPGGRPHGVRRRGVRRRRLGALHRGEAGRSRKSRYAVPGPVLLRQRRRRHRAQARARATAASWRSPRSTRSTCAAARCRVTVLDRGTAWLDTGTFESLMQAAAFVQAVEERQGIKIGCIEEVAFREGFIDADQLRALAEPLRKSGYGDYLLDVLAETEGALSDADPRAVASRTPTRSPRCSTATTAGVFLEWFKDGPFEQAVGHRLDLRAGQLLGVSAQGHACAASTSPTSRPARPSTSPASPVRCSTSSSTSGSARRRSARGTPSCSTTSTGGRSTSPRASGTPSWRSPTTPSLAYLCSERLRTRPRARRPPARPRDRHRLAGRHRAAAVAQGRGGADAGARPSDAGLLPSYDECQAFYRGLRT